MAKRGTHRRVTVDNFADAVRAELAEWAAYVDSSVVREAIHLTAEDTAADVSAAAPRRRHGGGKYANSIQAGFPERKGKKYSETVHAESPHYRLTHLLERPHRTRNGGMTRAFPHWSAGDAKIKDRLVAYINQLLK